MAHQDFSHIHTPLPSTRQIQFLLALKQEGSFHKAAKSCGVTQSTISSAIREMENILGAMLVDRSNRKKILFTALGEDMLHTGQEVINALGHIAERAKRSAKLLATPLRVGIIPTIAPYVLPRILRPLQQAFPDLTLHIQEMQTALIQEALENGTLDYGIIAFPYDMPNMMRFPLEQEKFYCAAPADFFPCRIAVTMQDIEQHPILLLSDGHCLRHHALSACSLKTIERHATQQDDVSATSLATLIQLVTDGYGLTLLPDMVINHSVLPSSIKILPIEPVAPTREIGGVWRKKSPVEQDAAALSLAIYRLLKYADIHDDHINPDLHEFEHIARETD